FAEVEKFIDMQIKHYSSGMQARLGFAVASHLRPEVLILDEVLSVGDLMFQDKSMDRMTELRRSGITILLVSHSLSSVTGLCQRAMLLQNGSMVAIGEVNEVVEQYMPKVAPTGHAYVDFNDRKSPHPARYISGSLEDARGERADQFDIGEDFYLRLRYEVKIPLPGLQLAVVIRTHLDDIVQTFDTDDRQFLGRHEVGVFEKRVK